MSFALALASLVIPVDVAAPVAVLWALFCAGLIWRSRHNMRSENRWLPKWLSTIVVGLSVGNIIRGLEGNLNGDASLADLLQIPAFGALVFVSWRLLRSRLLRRDIDAWLDASAVVLGTFTLLWIAFLGRFMVESGQAISRIALNGTYNLMSLVAFGIVLRVAATPGRRPVAYRMLGLAYFAGFISDLSTAVSIAEGTGIRLALMLSPIVFGLAAAALRHETADDIFSRHVETEHSLGLWRIFVIGLASVTPVVYLLDTATRNLAFKTVAVLAALGLGFSVFFRVARLLNAERSNVTRERRLAGELADLSGRSASEIRGELPRIAKRILPNSTPRLRAAPSDGAYAALDDFLATSREKYLTLQPPHSDLAPAEMKTLNSLVREAGLIARASEAVAIKSRMESEAEANKRIAANERRFRALVQNASDVVAVMDPHGTVSYISESCEKVLGYPPSRFMGDSLEWVAHHNDWDFARDYMQATINGTESRREHEVRAFHRDGSIKLLEYVITDMREVGGIDGLVVNITDVTEKRTLQRNLRDAETTDSLTLLLNRNAFIRAADSSIRRASISTETVAMAIVNLDDFRLVNEGYGTSIADEVLVELSHRVRQAVRAEDSVARLNGDEFGVLMPSGYTEVEAERIVERILEEVTEPIEVSGRTIALRATAGLVISGDGSATGISLLRDADTALDAAKQTHRGSLVRFNEAMGEEISERVELRNLLHNAIKHGKLRLAYQPVVDMETGLIVSMEALARWHDEERGDIGPAIFIPIAESTGMISKLGEWALRTACAQVVEWETQGFNNFSVSVNMSGHQLREENIIAKVSSVLKETGVSANRITIEITESVLIDDTEFIADRISALRNLGLRLAIDDFGTGYSSLSYLRRYEFDVLKIDRSFVTPLADDNNKREREIVNAMIKLAQALGAVTIAEGIEESEEYAVLRTLGCDYAQGYLFWYPIESDDVIEILESEIAGNTAA